MKSMMEATHAEDSKQKALRELVQNKILSSGSQNIKGLIDENDTETLAEIQQIMLQRDVDKDNQYIQNVKDEMRSIEDGFYRDQETVI